MEDRDELLAVLEVMKQASMAHGKVSELISMYLGQSIYSYVGQMGFLGEVHVVLCGTDGIPHGLDGLSYGIPIGHRMICPT